MPESEEAYYDALPDSTLIAQAGIAGTGNASRALVVSLIRLRKLALVQLWEKWRVATGSS